MLLFPPAQPLVAAILCFCVTVGAISRCGPFRLDAGFCGYVSGMTFCACQHFEAKRCINFQFTINLISYTIDTISNSDKNFFNLFSSHWIHLRHNHSPRGTQSLTIYKIPAQRLHHDRPRQRQEEKLGPREDAPQRPSHKRQ